jgi:hypothetical protein
MTTTGGKRRQGITKDAPTEAEIAARRERIAVLLVAKMPRAVICQRVGISERTLSRDIAAIKEAWIERASEQIGVLVAEELATLTEVDRRLWAEQLASSPIDPKAVETLLKVHDRRVRLLGMDKPQRVEITGADGGPLVITMDDEALLDEIDRMGVRLAQMARSTVPDPAP